MRIEDCGLRIYCRLLIGSIVDSIGNQSAIATINNHQSIRNRDNQQSPINPQSQ